MSELLRVVATVGNPTAGVDGIKRQEFRQNNNVDNYS
jgi:hypothetical protein